MKIPKRRATALTAILSGALTIAAVAYVVLRPESPSTPDSTDTELIAAAAAAPAAAETGAAPGAGVGATAAPAVLVSQSANRAGALALAGRSINATVYIFVTAPAGTRAVAFYLDDASMARPPRLVERVSPYDFAGTAANGTANGFNTASLASGRHTLTVRVTPAAGADQVVTATFTKAATTPGPSPNGKKWHPGNYVNAFYGEGTGNAINLINNTRDNSGARVLRGFSLIVNWAEIETRRGVYDFSRISAALNTARANNTSLIIQVADKSFNGRHPNCVPADMRTDPVYRGGQFKAGVYCAALVWIPAVQDRLNALYTALGRVFDGDAALEAVMTEEDSVRTSAPFYNGSAYAAQQLRGLTALSTAFPHTVVFKFLNWGPNVPGLFKSARDLGLGVGGPDLDPKDKTFATDSYRTYQGQMPLEISVQYPRVNKTITDGSSPTQMYDFAVSNPLGLHVSHIVWDPVTFSASNRVYDFPSMVVPVLKARHGQTNSACPRLITCR